MAIEELCYLCRMRKIEGLTSKKNKVLEEDFKVVRRKRSRNAITAWSLQLQAVAIKILHAFELRFRVKQQSLDLDYLLFDSLFLLR